MKIIKRGDDIPDAICDIGKTFKVLNEKEIKILRLRYGLEDGIPRTLQETGKEFGITRERVRQIESKALEKINIVIEYEGL